MTDDSLRKAALDAANEIFEDDEAVYVGANGLHFNSNRVADLIHQHVAPIVQLKQTRRRSISTTPKELN